MVDIIIPHYGVGELTALCQRCLETIREHTTGYRLIFVDNGSPEFDQIEPEVRSHPHILIRNVQNVGFVKAVNAGLRVSSAPHVVLVNNDIEAAAGWLDKLREGFNIPQVGIVGPLMRVEKDEADPVFKVSRPCWQSTWKVRNGGGLFVVPQTAMVAFFCVMFSREVLNAVGSLDETYGVGLGDDDDYCRRVHRLGFEIVLQQDLRIPHHHRSTFNVLYSPEEIKSMQAKALRKFHREA